MDRIERLDFAEATGRRHEEGLEISMPAGWSFAPGLIDLHVHLREPGQSAKETISTGAQGGRRGRIHHRSLHAEYLALDRQPECGHVGEGQGARRGVVNVLPTGAITKGIAGEELAPIGSMHKAGIVALTDDGHCIQNPELMRRALEYARMFNLVVMDHCQDYNLVGKGVMNEGYWSTVLGLPGWPSLGEEIIVSRNAQLAELCRHADSLPAPQRRGQRAHPARSPEPRPPAQLARSARTTSRSPTPRSRASTPISK
ncbi:MAG: hypothetical protein QM796_00860 [Chthoniobacteraceae bacterium]